MLIDRRGFLFPEAGYSGLRLYPTLRSITEQEEMEEEDSLLVDEGSVQKTFRKDTFPPGLLAFVSLSGFPSFSFLRCSASLSHRSANEDAYAVIGSHE